MFPLEMNGTIWPTVPLSIGRQPPSPENDAAWGDFEEIRVFPITREDIIKLNKVPEHVAQFDNDFWGLGDNAYMATLDLQHVCVNSHVREKTLTLVSKSTVSTRCELPHSLISPGINPHTEMLKGIHYQTLVEIIGTIWVIASISCYRSLSALAIPI